jgi:predicted DNA-binding transcriptional regulator AlpA
VSEIIGSEECAAEWPRLVTAKQAAALKGMAEREFFRLAALGLTPKAIPRLGGGRDRWRLEELRKWTPYKVSFQDGLNRQRGGIHKPAAERTPAPLNETFIRKKPKSVPLGPHVHHLYRHFDSDGKLLYVGISLSFIARLSEHAVRSGWFWKIARVEVTGYATEADALVAERIAIHQERPLHNIRHARKT